MKNAFSVILAFVAVTLASSAVHATAVLIDVQGDVGITASGSKLTATIGAELADGSVVKAGEGAKASVLAQSGELYEIKGGQSYTVGSKAGSARSTDLGSGITLAMREMAAGGEGPTVHGMVKKVEGPKGKLGGFSGSGTALVGTHPVGTALILGPTVTFRWSRSVGDLWQSPAIVIEDAAKKRLAVNAISAKAKSFKASASKTRLKKGAEYSWYLASTKGGVNGKTARFAFSTLAPVEEKRLAEEKGRIDSLSIGADGKGLLAAQLFYRYKLLDDMVKTLEPIWARTKAPFVKKLLHNGYSRMGMMSDAKKYE